MFYSIAGLQDSFGYVLGYEVDTLYQIHSTTPAVYDQPGNLVILIQKEYNTQVREL